MLLVKTNKMPENEMLSIIIPLYNKETTIKKTLESIFNQDYNDYEIIIVDDGSTDKGLTVINELHSDKISVYTQPNSGPSVARNLGVRKAKGDWIVFMDADDWFEPGAFKHFMSLVETEKNCFFYCCNYYIERNNSKYLYSSQYKTGFVKNNFLAWCAELCMPRAGASLYRRELLLKHPFNEKLRRYEDAESIFSMMRKERIFRSSTPVMTYNCNDSSASLPCKEISQDLIGNLVFKGKSFWEQYALFLLYKQGLELYPDKMPQLYRISLFQKVKYKFAAILIGRMKKYHII